MFTRVLSNAARRCYSTGPKVEPAFPTPPVEPSPGGSGRGLFWTMVLAGTAAAGVYYREEVKESLNNIYAKFKTADPEVKPLEVSVEPTLDQPVVPATESTATPASSTGGSALTATPATGARASRTQSNTALYASLAAVAVAGGAYLAYRHRHSDSSSQ